MVEMVKTRLVALGDLVDKIARVDPAKLAGDSFTYIDLGSVDQRRKVIGPAKSVASSEAPSRARQVLRSNDVLVSTVRPNLNGVARVPASLDGSIASTGFCVLRPLAGQLDANYLFHWVQSSLFVDDMVRKASGASYPAVSDKLVLSSHIPLPPYDEQRRIAAILDRAYELRTKRSQALAYLDSLSQSLFHSLLDENAESEQRPLEEVVTAVVDCPHTTPRWTESGVTCLRTSNLGFGRWDWTDHRFVSESQHHERSKRAYLEPNDIILSREGTVGVAAMVSEGMIASLGQRLVQVRPNPAIVVPQVLLQYLLFTLNPVRISNLMVGATSKHLNVKDLRNLPVPVPPLAAQHEFSMRISVIDRLKDRHGIQLSKFDALFASLQHRAFSGQL